MLAPIFNAVQTVLARLTAARATKLDNLDRLDDTLTSRAPAATALSTAIWDDTKAGRLDAAITSRLSGTDGRLAALAKMDDTVTSRLATTDTRLNALANLDVSVNSRSTLTAAQAAAQVWAETSRTVTAIPSVVKSVQRGTVQIPVSNALSVSVSITAVNPAKAFIVSSVSGPWSLDVVSRLRLALSGDGSAVVATRNAFEDNSNYMASAIVAFEVVEFN